MKRFSLIVVIVIVIVIVTALGCSLPVFAAPQSKPADSGGLDTVLKKMDTAAASFRNTQAEFEWDTYEKVIDEVDDYQTGTIYYRRNGKEIEMMADVKMDGNDLTKLKPEPKFVLFSKGKIRMYQPEAMDMETAFMKLTQGTTA